MSDIKCEVPGCVSTFTRNCSYYRHIENIHKAKGHDIPPRVQAVLDKKKQPKADGSTPKAKNEYRCPQPGCGTISKGREKFHEHINAVHKVQIEVIYINNKINL